MTSFWEAKYLSAEKSIEFLQTQHAQTLQSLHEQIESLQKQCADLSFKLSVQAPNIVEKEQFEKQHKSFNNDLKRKDNIIQEQIKSLDEKTKVMKTLQDRIRTLEKRLEVDTKFKDETIKQLKQQVDQQGGQIAQLTFQLHTVNQNKQKSSTSQLVNSPTIVTITSPRGGTNESKLRNKLSLLSVSTSSSSASVTERHSPRERNENSTFDSTSSEKFDASMGATNFSNSILPSNKSSSSSSSSSSKRNNSANSINSDNLIVVNNYNNSTKPLKALPLQEIRSKFSIIPDPKPFLQQNGFISSDNLTEIMPKRPVGGVLPPVKVTQKLVNKLAVDSPHKTTTNTTILHSSPDLHHHQSNNHQ